MVSRKINAPVLFSFPIALYIFFPSAIHFSPFKFFSIFLFPSLLSSFFKPDACCLFLYYLMSAFYPFAPTPIHPCPASGEFHLQHPLAYFNCSTPVGASLWLTKKKLFCILFPDLISSYKRKRKKMKSLLCGNIWP